MRVADIEEFLQSAPASLNLVAWENQHPPSGNLDHATFKFPEEV
jgi:hypothetical protein